MCIINFFIQVEDIRKPRGISVDDDPKANQSSSVRPCQTHQPRSYQIRHRRIVSEIHNLAAAGSSPDLLKKQSSYQTISKKTLYRPKNAEVQLPCTVCVTFVLVLCCTKLLASMSCLQNGCVRVVRAPLSLPRPLWTTKCSVYNCQVVH